MKTIDVPGQRLDIYTREEFLDQFNLVIDGRQYSLKDMNRPQGVEADYVVRAADQKKFIIAPLQPRDCFQTGDVAVIEYEG